eukprot:1501665-Amphidinium_carterae.1
MPRFADEGFLVEPNHVFIRQAPIPTACNRTKQRQKRKRAAPGCPATAKAAAGVGKVHSMLTRHMIARSQIHGPSCSWADCFQLDSEHVEIGGAGV